MKERENSEGSPHRQLTAQTSGYQEHEARSDRSHEELMAFIRQGIAQKREDSGQRFDPAVWIGELLTDWAVRKSFREDSTFIAPEDMDHDLGSIPDLDVLYAWNVISHPHIKSDFHKRRIRGCIADEAKILGERTTLEPRKAKVIASLAEAAGIPFASEQTIFDASKYISTGKEVFHR